MKNVEKSTIVSEYVPSGYDSWTQYYRRMELKAKAMVVFMVFTLILAYATVGYMEYTHVL